MILIAYGAPVAEKPFHTSVMRFSGAEKSAFCRGHEAMLADNAVLRTAATCVCNVKRNDRPRRVHAEKDPLGRKKGRRKEKK